MSPSLYDLAGEVARLDEMLGALGGDVSTEEGKNLELWAEQFQWQMKEKIDAYGHLYRNIETDAAKVAEEIARLNARKNVLMNRTARLEALAEISLKRMGIRKIEGAETTISLRKNGGKLSLEVVVEAKDLPEKFQKPRDPVVDNDAVREALEKNPEDPELVGKAKLLERGEYISIK